MRYTRVRAGVAALCAAALLTIYTGTGSLAHGWSAEDETVGYTTIAQDPTLSAVAPEVAMPSGILRTMDGRTLWSRDPDAQRAMASTTKIMTALVVLEHAEMSDVVTVSRDAAGVGEAEIDLRPGQEITVGMLLEGMLVRSGNDAAIALAEHVGGSLDGFAVMMNQKAADLGLSHSSFANPHGLDEPGHYSSAQDLATLSTLAMSDPRFAEMVSQPSVMVDDGQGGAKRYESSNKLLGTYEGANGVKTGWTNKAGYCLVASAQRNDIGLVAVVLGTDSEDERFDEARVLLDWGYEHYRPIEVATAETTAALVPVTDYLDRTVPAVVGESVTVPVFDLDGEISASADVVHEVEAPVLAGQRLGTLTVRQGERLLAQVPIVAVRDVAAPDTWERIEIWFTRIWRSVFGGQLQAPAVPLV
ncbi:D-alanyl-D-alanine carboxypeptidase family protein [Anaerosoma tenue]|uniref:D-alanyl-D-alanine carboxypeptidase family protein n=1 Tax=Anaerosoma tenue TaxID=2933588 RepID=UPI00226099CE|nr:D-alanyl-D-alanine carboxypeptidase family protein [Anaerosoma tenue]MCK8114294.1 D-alanyl-D-alanine carboxypeptidase [Anaerosoma tenue]